MTLLSKRQQSSIDAGQMDLFFVGTMSPHQRLTIIGQAPPISDPDDFANIASQEIAKRALEIAAVANHPLQFIGKCHEIDTLIAAGRKIGALQSFHSYPNASPLDLNLEVAPTSDVDLRLPPPAESSEEIARRVAAALPLREQLHPLLMDGPCVKLLRDAATAMRLDEQLVQRVIGVACSIAALAGSDKRIGRIHIAEALSYVRMPPPEPLSEPASEPTPEPEPVHDELLRLRSEGREIIAVDPKRLEWQSGDIGRSYSAQGLAEKGAIKSPFRFQGGEWVNTGGCFHNDKGWLECYRVVPVEQFDGPSAPYAKHDWERMRGNREVGGYHGMSAKHGSREIVLQGPPLIFVAGEPEQSALL